LGGGAYVSSVLGGGVPGLLIARKREETAMSKANGAAPEIEIFYAPVCGLCAEAMNFFRSRGLSFHARAVEWGGEAFVDSENARAMFAKCGGVVDFVPQIFVNGMHIAGWRKLEPMIESGEFDRLLTATPA